MTKLSVDREVRGEVVVLGLVGELDLADAALAEAELQAALRDAPVVLLDLSRLDFMDSSGVRVVLHADASARAQGRRLAVLAGAGPPLRVLSALGLTESLDLVTARSDVLGPGAAAGAPDG